MILETKPSRFPTDTDPSGEGLSRLWESLATLPRNRMTVGLTGSHLRVWGGIMRTLADREGWGAALGALVGVVRARPGGARGGATPFTTEVSLVRDLGDTGSPFSPGVVSGVVWFLLGLLNNGHRRRGPDSVVLDVLCDDAESALNWRCKPDGRGGREGIEGVVGLGAVEGRDWLRLTGGTDGNWEGADKGEAEADRLKLRGTSKRGGRRPDVVEGGSLTLLMCAVESGISVGKSTVLTGGAGANRLGSKVVGGGNPSSTGDSGEVFPTEFWLVSIDIALSDVPEECWRAECRDKKG